MLFHWLKTKKMLNPATKDKEEEMNRHHIFGIR